MAVPIEDVSPELRDGIFEPPLKDVVKGFVIVEPRVPACSNCSALVVRRVYCAVCGRCFPLTSVLPALTRNLAAVKLRL